MWYLARSSGVGSDLLVGSVDGLHIWGHKTHPKCEVVRVEGGVTYQYVYIEFKDKRKLRYEFTWVHVFDPKV